MQQDPFLKVWTMRLASANWMQFMALVQCKGVGLGQAFGSMLVCLWSFLLVSSWTGCSTQHYEESANRVAASLIAEKTPLVANMDPSFALQEVDPADLSPLPVSDKLEPFLGKTGQSEVGTRVVSLEVALKLATDYNRNYLRNKEDLYLQALALSLVRFDYAPMRGNLASKVQTEVDGMVKETTIKSGANVKMSWLLRTGGQLATQFTSNFVQLVSGNGNLETSSEFVATFTQPFLRGAGYRIAIENLTQAERDLLYAIRRFTRYRKEFSVSIVQSYYQVLQNRDRARNAFQGYESFKASVEREQARAAEGETPLSELNRLKESLLSTEQGWISAIRNYQLSRDQFKMELGLSMDTAMILDEKELDGLTIHHPDLSVEQAVEVALVMRLDLDTVRDELIDAERRINVAADGLQAQLDLELSGTLSSRPGSGVAFPNPRERSWTASLGVDLPINRIKERNNYRASLIGHDRARRQLELSLDQVKLDIQDGWRNLEQRKREFEISQVRVELSQNRRDEEILKRELGLGLALDLVDAQNDLINSQNQLTSALISHTIARLGFWRDMGILFIKEGGQWEEKDYELLQ